MGVKHMVEARGEWAAWRHPHPPQVRQQIVDALRKEAAENDRAAELYPVQKNLAAAQRAAADLLEALG